MYATFDDLKSAYAKEFLIRISNFVAQDDFTDIEEDNCILALTDASSLIDGYLMGRYATPVSPAPAYFKPDCLSIAVATLIERKGYQKDTADEKIVDTKYTILKKYMAIASGDIDLSIPSGGVTAPSANILTSAPEKIFSEETLDKY